MEHVERGLGILWALCVPVPKKERGQHIPYTYSLCVRGTAWVVTREPVTSGHGPPPRPLLREHTAVSFSPGLSYPRSPLFW